MINNFKQLVRRYENVKADLSQQEDDIYKICKFLCGVTDEHIDGEDLSFYNPFVFAYNEKFQSMYIENGTLNIRLYYVDTYDGYDSNSKITVPEHIVDLYLKGEFITLRDEVLRLCRVGKHREELRAVEGLQRQAEQLGYKLVKEEK